MRPTFVAFSQQRRIARGELSEVALLVRDFLTSQPHVIVQVFNEQTSAELDLDLRGSDEQILAWIREHHPDTVPPPKTRGRPKLGVISREVTLLPRQWDWLAQQSGGASVTLRRLVDQASKDAAAVKRQAQDAGYRFSTAIAGDEPGFEEAMRALYAADRPAFHQCTSDWPVDVQDHLTRLTDPLWQNDQATPT